MLESEECELMITLLEFCVLVRLKAPVIVLFLLSWARMASVDRMLEENSFSPPRTPFPLPLLPSRSHSFSFSLRISGSLDEKSDEEWRRPRQQSEIHVIHSVYTLGVLKYATETRKPCMLGVRFCDTSSQSGLTLNCIGM